MPDEMIFDEGISGDFWNRSAFSKLRQAVRERKVTAVFMQYSDRISRKAWQQLRFLEECHNAGIELYVSGQLVDDSRSSKLLFGIRSTLDEDAKALLLERTKQGKEQRARAGLPAGGQVPYGYDVIYPTPRRSEWCINEQEALIVRNVFSWYNQDGLSMLSIAKRLSQLHIPTKTDAVGAHRHPKHTHETWSYSSVRGILTNEAYTGTSYQMRVSVTERSLIITEDGQERVKAKRSPRPENERIPFAVPAIISREIFDAVQARLQRNRELSRRRMRHTYLLRARWLRCGCGLGMVGIMLKERYQYYRCSNIEGKRCPGMLRADEAESQVMVAMERVLMEPERLAAHVRERQENSARERHRLEQELDGFRNDIKACDEEWARILEGYGKNLFSEKDITDYKTKLDRRRENLRQQIRQCEERLTSLGMAFEQVKSLVAYVERIRSKQLVANATEAATLYPTVDTEPQLVETIKYEVEKMEKQAQRFHAKWSVMSPEQRQTVEAKWDKRQVRERLRSMTIDEKQQLFDALGLKAEWTRRQPLKITFRLPYVSEIGPS